MAVIHKCDAIFFCPGWEKGKGTLIEHKFAEEHDIPIWYDVVEADERDRKPPFRILGGPGPADLSLDRYKGQLRPRKNYEEEETDDS